MGRRSARDAVAKHPTVALGLRDEARCLPPRGSPDAGPSFVSERPRNVCPTIDLFALPLQGFGSVKVRPSFRNEGVENNCRAMMAVGCILDEG